jgi:uncharacterized Zn-finger protein
MLFQCNVSSKFYKTQKSLWQHNKNIHIIGKTQKKEKKPEDTNCSYCNKLFSHKGNLVRHMKICKSKPSVEINNNEIVTNNDEIKPMIINLTINISKDEK